MVASPSSVALGKDISSGLPVTLEQAQRLGGTYVLGKTGMGKTTLFVNLILQDIEAGMGLCFLTPHSDAIDDILARLPAYRVIGGVRRPIEDDVILLDPLDKDFAFGLNLFQCDPTDEEQVSRTVSYVLEVFAKLFTKEGSFDSEAPNMEVTLRNAAYTLIDNLAAYGTTMAEIQLLIDDEDARLKLISNVTDRHVERRRFWKRYHRLPQAEKDNITRSTYNRVDRFLSNLFIKQIVGQSKTTLNFRQIMDGRKILLVKLPRRDREITNLVGSVIIGQIANAAFSREDSPINDRVQFNLYADEYQRFATPTFAELLAEVRKYKIATTVAHQWRDQLDFGNRNASKGAANMVVFQVQGNDADEFAPEFAKKPPPAEPRREVVLQPVRDVVGHLLQVGHTHPAIDRFLRQWKLEKFPSQLGFFALDDELILHLRKQGDVLAYLNSVFYVVMKERNPFQPLPLPLFEWAVRALPLPFFNATQYQRWALEEYQILGENHLVTKYRKRRIVHIPYVPKDYCSFLLTEGVRENRVATEDEKAVYARLWQAYDEQNLQLAFTEYEQLVRTKLDAAFTQAIKNIYFSDAPIWAYASQDATLAEWYATLQNDLNAAIGNREADTELRENLGLTDLVIPFHQLRWEKRYRERYYADLSGYYWRLEHGELERLDFEQFIKEQIEKIVVTNKSTFEGFIRDFREVLQVLVDKPVTSGSGIYEMVGGVQRTHADMVEEMKLELLKIDPFIAYCKLQSGQYTIRIDYPRSPDADSVVKTRRERIIAQTQACYCRKRAEVDAEISTRQALLTKPEKQKRAKQDEDDE